MPIRVLIADDEALVRSGFAMILDTQPDIEVVGQAVDGHEAVEQAHHLRPDVVLMDIRMPGLNGLDATRRIREAGIEARVLVLTTFDGDRNVYEAIKAGASGFLLKDVSPDQLAAAVRTVAAGDALLAPLITRRLLAEFIRRPPPGDERPKELAYLTEREIDVLLLIAGGLSNAEIGQELHISAATVKTHVTRLLAKLHLRDRVQAVVYAYETGLVRPGS
jgi:DNA-binding NarL/FixJ family response regulator